MRALNLPGLMHVSKPTQFRPALVALQTTLATRRSVFPKAAARCAKSVSTTRSCTLAFASAMRPRVASARLMDTSVLTSRSRLVGRPDISG